MRQMNVSYIAAASVLFEACRRHCDLQKTEFKCAIRNLTIYARLALLASCCLAFLVVIAPWLTLEAKAIGNDPRDLYLVAGTPRAHSTIAMLDVWEIGIRRVSFLRIYQIDSPLAESLRDLGYTLFPVGTLAEICGVKFDGQTN